MVHGVLYFGSTAVGVDAKKIDSIPINIIREWKPEIVGIGYLPSKLHDGSWNERKAPGPSAIRVGVRWARGYRTLQERSHLLNISHLRIPNPWLVKDIESEDIPAYLIRLKVCALCIFKLDPAVHLISPK